jgi:siderophore synthetase component
MEMAVPLPLDLGSAPERRVVRQLAEAMLFEGLVDPELRKNGDRLRFEWRAGGKHFRCLGAIAAYDRVRVEADSVEADSGKGWRAARLAELVECLPGEPERRLRLLDELERTVANCRWNDANLPVAHRRPMDFAALEGALDEGHAYHPCFKARTGFSEDDQRRYGPEAGNAFQLAWLLVDRSEVHQRLPRSETAFWTEELGEPVLRELQQRRAERRLDNDRFALLPLHPWQWEALKDGLLAPWLAAGKAHFLGLAGDRYTASQSVRTLLNADRPASANVKLSMNMVNTSSLRTIEPHSVCTAPLLSRWLGDVVAGDPLFETRYPLAVLDEYAGIIAGREGPLAGQLAAIWRRSTTSILGPGEAAVPFNALMMVERDGEPFVDEWIRRYSFHAWLAQLLQVAVLPVWHLLVGHGIATESHGQNMVLIHRNGWPVRLALRDFHDSLEYVPDFLRDRDRVPDFMALDPVYRSARPDQFYWMETVESLGELVNDALFVFNLAEVSHLFHTCYGLPEADFWATVRQLLAAYARERGLVARQDRLGLFRPKIAVETLLARKLGTGRSSRLVANALHA